MKKLLSIILCAIMLIATASPAFANEPINDNVNVGLEAYANEVIAEYIPISMGTVDETDTFFLTQGYRVINNPDPNSRTFFLFRNGKCEGELTASYVNGKYASSFAPHEIPEITEVYESNEPFALIAENNSLILFTAHSSAVISGINTESTTDYKDITAEYQRIALSGGFNVEARDEALVADDVHLAVRHVDNDDDPYEGNGLCWAACASSVGQYHSGGTLYSAMQIYNYVCNRLNETHVYGSVSTIKEGMKKYGYSATSISGGMKLTDVKSKLRADKPIIACIHGLGNTAHAVVICGYQVSGTGNYSYEVMDPNENIKRYTREITPNNTVEFPYVVASGTYLAWDDSIW